MSEVANYCSKCCASNSGGIGGVECIVVCGTNPTMDAKNTPADTEISILFSVAPDLSSCNSGTIVFKPAVLWTLSEGNSPEEIVLIPETPLPLNQDYTVLIENVVSLDSEPVFPYMLRFST